MIGPPPARNPTLFQSFEWHTPSTPPAPHETHCSTSHYNRLTRLLPTLADLGTTSVWLPPGCKANSPEGNGYDIYDIWDLGEFQQKVVRSTKWGSKEELDGLITKARECGLELIWDAVLSHKTAGDRTDECWAVEVDKADRRVEICPPKKIEAWLRFDFPGRDQKGMKYSSMKWEAKHFNGTDWDQRAEKHAIYKIIDDPATYPRPDPQPPTATSGNTLASPRSSRFSSFLQRFTSSERALKQQARRPQDQAKVTHPKRPGKGWAEDVDGEHGNNDYLLFSNIDYAHPEVREDILNWGKWMVEDTGIEGFRLDAAQHISYGFIKEWIRKTNAAKMEKTGREAFFVGEIWTGEVPRITKWIDSVQDPSSRPNVRAFDAPLLYKFSHLSESIRQCRATKGVRSKATAESKHTKTPPEPDLRTLLRNTLLEQRPGSAVTVVTNHDTQPGQASYTPMTAQLKPLFYAFTLLREAGLPCVFWGDLYGTHGPHAEEAVGLGEGSRSLLAELMMCRKLFAYGEQRDYFDSSSCIGWTRAGTDNRYAGCAMVLSIDMQSKGLSVKKMKIGRPGEVWRDVLQNVRDETCIDEEGYGAFLAGSMGVSVFVKEYTVGVEKFPVGLDTDVYGGR
ncbi:hypothetical protein LTR37_013413 [Vermiconidia calcicola]|uniref:Uncharacterized protein n=1 Tax=Vermiconidia calcicola TaxID=1690605 RepID=A0ACC3MWK3_9PEZI|nr:hypothetical protein LTR37_013413 [Vermiconidia calcicola]